MTAKEFKEKYPRFAHLEGEQLWNIMEDILFQDKRFQRPNEVKDWKGNILKEGHEFCIVKVIDRQTISFAGFAIFNEDGTTTLDTTHAEERRPDKPCWIPGEWYLAGKCIHTFIIDGYTISISLSSLNFDLYERDDVILVIKGLSDSKELYYGKK
jgi:hypothetical protein